GGAAGRIGQRGEAAPAVVSDAPALALAVERQQGETAVVMIDAARCLRLRALVRDRERRPLDLPRRGARRDGPVVAGAEAGAPELHLDAVLERDPAGADRDPVRRRGVGGLVPAAELRMEPGVDTVGRR